MENTPETTEMQQPVIGTIVKKNTTTKYVIGAIAIIAVLAFGGWFFVKGNAAAGTPDTMLNSNSAGSISYSGRQYTKAYTFPESVQPDQKSESYEWTTSGETVENWTTLITTHKITSTKAGTDISAETYAQNVVALQEGNGAFIIEKSVINQDSAELQVDPKNPPYFLSYLFVDGDMTELDLQKIQMLPDGTIGSVIYGERFKTKSQADMKSYFESKEESQKRIELIKLPFPY